MRLALETADAWLDGISTAWHRVLLFWGSIVLFSFIGGQFGKYPGFGPIFQLGGLTYFLDGPLMAWAILAAAYVWIRFVIIGDCSVATFFLMGMYLAINGSYFDTGVEMWKFVLLQIVAALALGGRVLYYYRVEKR